MLYLLLRCYTMYYNMLASQVEQFVTSTYISEFWSEPISKSLADGDRNDHASHYASYHAGAQQGGQAIKFFLITAIFLLNLS